MAAFRAFIFLLVIHLVNCEEEPEQAEKIVRIQSEENGLKIVTMSDGETLVNFQLDSQGDIQDCKVVRRRRMALGMLKYDVIIFPISIEIVKTGLLNIP